MNLKTVKCLCAATLVSLFSAGSLLAQSSDTSTRGTGDSSPLSGLVTLALAVLIIVSMWKVYAKAGQPGWACIIPIYNVYILVKIAGKPGWWTLLCFIPLVNIIVMILVTIDVAKNFGKGTGFGLGLAFLSFIFYPILAFGDATYQGSASW